MHPTQARQLVEAIITMPTAEMAVQRVHADLQSLLHPMCAHIVIQMLQEEQKSRGVTKQYRALTALNAYTSALLRRQLLEDTDTKGSTEALPELIVVTKENASEQCDVEAEAYDFKPDAFDNWWKILKPHQPDNHVGTDEPLNDLAISNLLCNIDNRLLEVAIKTSDARTRPQETILQCRGILRDCYRLLTQAEPTYATVDTLAVRGKKANTLKYIAHAYSSQGDAAQAKFFFQRAADLFTEIDKKREADHCLADIAWLQCHHEGSVDAAIESLHTILETIAENTLEHAQYLLDLGQIYCAADEDHEAEQILLRAEKELNQLGCSNPTGKQLANALIQTLMTILSDPQVDMGTRVKEKAMDCLAGQTDTDKSPILTQNLLRNLYRRLYFTLEKIYLLKGDVNQADKYMELLEQMDGTINDGNQMNLEFSEQMLTQGRFAPSANGRILSGELGESDGNDGHNCSLSQTEET